mmetsp:Transcript_18086/g.45351  ORF Transcript_18086/g.45351 Transcript_18086/m.45351 type:complete len:295 (+) Transcript_18086:964-1848(+)
MLCEPLLHFGSFVLPQQSGVDEEGAEPIPEGAVHQPGRDAGIDAARNSPEDVVAGSYLFPDLRDLDLCEVVHAPLLEPEGTSDNLFICSPNIVGLLLLLPPPKLGVRQRVFGREAPLQKVFDDLFPVFGVGDLGMELDAVEVFLGVRDRCEPTVACCREHFESLCHFRDLVAVAHPDLVPRFQPRKQPGTRWWRRSSYCGGQRQGGGRGVVHTRNGGRSGGAAVILRRAGGPYLFQKFRLRRIMGKMIRYKFQLRIPELPLRSGGDGAPQRVHHLLQAVADPQDWNLLLVQQFP